MFDDVTPAGSLPPDLDLPLALAAAGSGLAWSFCRLPDAGLGLGSCGAE